MEDSTSWGERSGESRSGRSADWQLSRPPTLWGSGGMSSVFRAVHVETGHEVALKVLTRTLARNSTLLVAASFARPEAPKHLSIPIS